MPKKKQKDGPKKTITVHRKGYEPVEIKWHHHNARVITHKNRKFQFYGRPINNAGAENWMKDKVETGYSVYMGIDDIGLYLFRSLNKTKKPYRIIETKKKREW